MLLFLLFEINYIFFIKKANIRHFQVWYFDGGYERVQKEHAGLKFVQLDWCLLTPLFPMTEGDLVSAIPFSLPQPLFLVSRVTILFYTE